MRFKGKLFSSSILIFTLCCLPSCDTKINLLTTYFDVFRNPVTISDDNYQPSIFLFKNKEDIIDFFNIYPYEIGDKFYEDIENFERNFGFDNYLVIYFSQILNVSCDVNAYIDETENDNIAIVFNYNYPKSDIYLPADVYYQNFYLIDKFIFKNEYSKITFKIAEDVLFTMDFKEDKLWCLMLLQLFFALYLFV